MNKRLRKRHDRQVARARQHAKQSEPDVRTPEQRKAAREASQPAGGFSSGPRANYTAPSFRNATGATTGSPSKVGD